MDLAARKESLLNFIRSRFDEHDFERAQMLGADIVNTFRTYNDFLNFQRSVIDQFTSESIHSAEFLKNMIPMIQMVDKESMLPWAASGFAFLPGNRVMIFHER